MSERHAPLEVLADSRQGLAHITKQEKFAGRYAIRMGSYLPLANIDLAVWKKLTKVMISSTVAEAEL